MADLKHTPGPWKACRSHEEYNGPMWDLDDDERTEYEAKPFVRIMSARGQNVVNAHDFFEFEPGDALLIECAPDMLDLLRRMRDAIWEREETALHTPHLVREADKLIAKATGETL